ncbi:MAG: mannitol dehydrogenase family protein [Solirubrobacterales bacterium]|nr:mannitol dehydrogenase family protein [Solirubrobacterales bacterium]
MSKQATNEHATAAQKPDAEIATLALSGNTLASLADRLPVPRYDRKNLCAGVVHVGVGAFHRAHQAMYHDRLLNQEPKRWLGWGICGVGLLPGDRRMKEALDAQDGLYTLVEKDAGGGCSARVIGSIKRYLLAPSNPEPVIEAMADERVRIISLTITEGGYNVDPDSGEFDADDADVARDLAPDAAPRTVFGVVTEALDRRRARRLRPFTVMSCDNLPGNGERSRLAFTSFARLRDPSLGEWIDSQVAFPNSMVDRITPATTAEDRDEVRSRFGIEDRWPVVCESFAEWVLEDSFSAGRPAYDRAGVRLVADVGPYELMKLRLVNAGHQALAYFGYLCGYRFVHEAAQDPDLRAFLLGYLDEEGVPTLPSVPGVDLRAYTRALIERFANASVPDTLARVCAYGSDRIPTFLLPVIRAQLAGSTEVRRSAAVIAAWARYAQGIDEEGQPIEVVDRFSDTLTETARRQRDDPDAFLAQRQWFGDLADEPRFATAFRSSLRSLHERGARATVRALIETPDAAATMGAPR